MLVGTITGPAEFAPPGEIDETMRNLAAMVERLTGVALTLTWRTDPNTNEISCNYLSYDYIAPYSAEWLKYRQAATELANGLGRWMVACARANGQEIAGFLVKLDEHMLIDE